MIRAIAGPDILPNETAIERKKIDHLRASKTLPFKTRPSAKPFL